MNEKKNRRRFDEEFKRSAVGMLERGERSVQELGMELGVSNWSLYEWKKRYGSTAASTGAGGTGEGPASPDLAEENARLRRELETVSRQRDILKKACAILGQEPWNASR